MLCLDIHLCGVLFQTLKKGFFFKPKTVQLMHTLAGFTRTRHPLRRACRAWEINLMNVTN